MIIRRTYSKLSLALEHLSDFVLQEKCAAYIIVNRFGRDNLGKEYILRTEKEVSNVNTNNVLIFLPYRPYEIKKKYCKWINGRKQPFFDIKIFNAGTFTQLHPDI